MSSNQAFILVVAVIWLLVALRNQMVYRVQMRRIEEISAACLADLDSKDFHVSMSERYAELERPGYAAMVFDLRHWTYSQFYPKAVK